MRFSIGSFNLFNLVLPRRSFYGRKYKDSEYKKKIDWIAEQLNKMNADLVGFQEVFHREALAEAVEKSGLYNGHPPITHDATGDLPRVGFVSRFPIVYQESIPNFPPESLLSLSGSRAPVTTFSRPILKVRVQLPEKQGELVIFVTHLKSKRPEFDLPDGEERPKSPDFKALAVAQARSLLIRSCEAAALRCLIIEQRQRERVPLIVMGDMNDGLHSVTTSIVAGQPPQRFWPPDEKRQVWYNLLLSTYEFQARRSCRDVYYTHLHNGSPESLDHILVSDDFSPTFPNAKGKIEYMKLFNDHLVDNTVGNEKQPYHTSDHAQVVVHLKMFQKGEKANHAEG